MSLPRYRGVQRSHHDPAVTLTQVRRRIEEEMDTSRLGATSCSFPKRVGGYMRSREMSILFPHMVEDYINYTLPTEVFLKIFSYLDVQSLHSCAQVCKTWNTLALDGSVWRNVNLVDYFTSVKDRIVQDLAMRSGPYLKTLNLTYCVFISFHSMCVLAEMCPNLEVLILAHCGALDDKGLMIVGQRCPLLKKLNIEYVSGITKKSLRTIGEGCKWLESVNIGGCRQLTEDAVICLATSCPLITELSVHNLMIFTDKGIRVIIASLPNLVTLNLRQAQRSWITEEAFMTIGQHCHSLTTLNVGNCPGVTDMVLHALGDGCPKLSSLVVSSCESLSDDGFGYLIKHCPLLRTLKMEGCKLVSNDTLEQIGTRCHNLAFLDMTRCIRISSTGLRHLKMSLPIHRSLTFLALNECCRVRDKGLRRLGHLQALRRLEIRHCVRVTSQAIKMMKDRYPNIHLEADPSGMTADSISLDAEFGRRGRGGLSTWKCVLV